MRKWLLSFSLIAAMLLGVAGVGVHQHEGSCPLTNLPDCCKKAKAGANEAEHSMARLCCNLNCSEPGSSGFHGSASFSPTHSVPATGLLLANALSWNDVAVSSRYSHLAVPNYSSPKYIQHLALLI
jgi:hypothetical protein